MTYISPTRREELDRRKAPIVTANDLTYAIARAALGNQLQIKKKVQEAIDNFLPRQPRYADFAMVVGCIYLVAKDLDRRKVGYGPTRVRLEAFADRFWTLNVAPLEDAALAKNGGLGQ